MLHSGLNCIQGTESAGLNVQLEADGFPCTSISGELDMDKRDLVIKEFRSGVTKVLIATDVLARGFDVQQVITSFCGLPLCLDILTLPHSSACSGTGCHNQVAACISLHSSPQGAECW